MGKDGPIPDAILARLDLDLDQAQILALSIGRIAQNLIGDDTQPKVTGVYGDSALSKEFPSAEETGKFRHEILACADAGEVTKKADEFCGRMTSLIPNEHDLAFIADLTSTTLAARRKLSGETAPARDLIEKSKEISRTRSKDFVMDSTRAIKRSMHGSSIVKSPYVVHETRAGLAPA